MLTLNVVDDKVIPIWNPMGVIPGYIKDEVVIIGNHRDGELTTYLRTEIGTYSLFPIFSMGMCGCYLACIHDILNY